MSQRERKKLEEYTEQVMNLVRNSGVNGISDRLLIQQMRESGCRVSTLRAILREHPNIKATTETSRRDGRPEAVTVYRYILRDAESLAEATEDMGRVVGTIHADRPAEEPTARPDVHPIYELARERLEHRPPARDERPPAFNVTFRSSGINNPTDMAGWWPANASEEDWVWE